MSYFQSCIAYKDIEVKIRIEEDVVYLSIDDKNNNIGITFNPCQLLTLNKYITAALSTITLADIINSKYFGNLTVEVENANLTEENFKIPIGCYDNEFFFDNSNEETALVANS